jgi:hypothetical protein
MTTDNFCFYFQKRLIQSADFYHVGYTSSIRTMKLSNIGPGDYLDGVGIQGIPGSAGTYPPPPADRVQSFQTLFVSIK